MEGLEEGWLMRAPVGAFVAVASNTVKQGKVAHSAQSDEEMKVNVGDKERASSRAQAGAAG